MKISVMFIHFMLTIFFILAFAPSCFSYSSTEESEWTLFRLDQYPLATCLDGSSGVYYTRRSPKLSNPSKKVLMYVEGGGWCMINGTSGYESDCAGRSLMRLGSTVNDTVHANMFSRNTYFNQDPSVNPAFHDYTYIYLRYCDGASFSGMVQDGPFQTNPTLYARGNFILEATFQDLYKHEILTKETSVFVFSGASAGGLTVYLHSHQVRKWVDPSTEVVGLADSGFFQEWDASVGPYYPVPFADAIKSVSNFSNASASLPPSCVAAFPGDQQYKCLLAPETAKHVEVPLLIVQSQWDAWQLQDLFGFDYTNQTSSTVSESAIDFYVANLTSDIIDTWSSLPRQSKSGVYLSSCLHHAFIDFKHFSQTTVDGNTAGEAMGKWMENILSQNGSQIEPNLWVSDRSIPVCPLRNTTSPPEQKALKGTNRKLV